MRFIAHTRRIVSFDVVTDYYEMNRHVSEEKERDQVLHKSLQLPVLFL